MSHKLFKKTAIALAVPGLAIATPALAAAPTQSAPATTMQTSAYTDVQAPVYGVLVAEHGKHRKWKKGHRHDRYESGDRYDRYDDDYYDDRRYRGRQDVYYDQPIRRDTRIWRGRDGQYYCRKDDGTTGLLIGGVVGGLIGNEVAGRGDRTLGAIIGAAGGAILGRAIDRSNSRCRRIDQHPTAVPTHGRSAALHRLPCRAPLARFRAGGAFGFVWGRGVLTTRGLCIGPRNFAASRCQPILPSKRP